MFVTCTMTRLRLWPCGSASEACRRLSSTGSSRGVVLAVDRMNTPSAQCCAHHTRRRDESGLTRLPFVGQCRSNCAAPASDGEAIAGWHPTDGYQTATRGNPTPDFSTRIVRHSLHSDLSICRVNPQELNNPEPQTPDRPVLRNLRRASRTHIVALSSAEGGSLPATRGPRHKAQTKARWPSCCMSRLERGSSMSAQ